MRRRDRWEAVRSGDQRVLRRVGRRYGTPSSAGRRRGDQRLLLWRVGRRNRAPRSCVLRRGYERVLCGVCRRNTETRRFLRHWRQGLSRKLWRRAGRRAGSHSR